MEEIWKDIEGYEGIYQVSNMGRVKSFEKYKKGKNNSSVYVPEKIMKSYINFKGYVTVGLTKEGKQITYSVHRLVCKTFLPNPYNKPCIDHINCNRSDNRLENLRWVTHKENSNNPLTLNNMMESNIGCKNPMYGVIGKDNKRSKQVIQKNMNGEIIRIWGCITDIKRELGLNTSNISACCRGKRNKVGGYIWQYADDYERIPFKVFDLEIYRKKVA